MTLDWDKIDELANSFARPYSVYVCSTAIAIACLIPASAPIAIPVAGAVVGGVAYFRSMDKKTDATAATTDKQTAAVAAGGQP